jgi:N-hydroxyarylamine O-acetyltransferase
MVTIVLSGLNKPLMVDLMQSTELAGQYIQEIGLPAQTPDLGLLSAISQRHVAKFAFSSIGALLGDALPLDVTSLYERIVVRQRGGYCFEQNGLMYEVLKSLGFSVSLFLARVIYNQDIHPGLTHRLTLVEIDGLKYVVDVGFGPLGPALPVSMSGDESHETFRTFRIAEPHPGEFHMQTLKDGAFYSLYKFELTGYGQADCEVGHFYSHKHPQASFVNNLVVSTILDHEVRSLRNLEICTQTASGDQKELIQDDEQLKSILKSRFDIKVTQLEAHRLFTKALKPLPARKTT